MNCLTYTQEELKNEIWKDIINYEGYYKISNLGRIMSTVNKKHKVLSIPNKNSYVNKILCREGVKKTILVHREVLKTFVTESNLPVDHINRIKNDNRLENLRYVTPRENTTHMISEYKDVGFSYCSKRDKFKSSILIEKNKYFLGYFNQKQTAIDAYNLALDNWKINKEKPYEKLINTNKFKGVTFQRGKYVVYFQKGGHKIFLGNYEDINVAVNVINKANKEWDDYKIVPIYINLKSTSRYKYIYLFKNRWVFKINKHIKRFNTEKEAVEYMLNFKNNTNLTEEDKNSISSYYTEERLKKLNNHGILN